MWWTTDGTEAAFIGSQKPTAPVGQGGSTRSGMLKVVEGEAIELMNLREVLLLYRSEL